MTMKDFLLVGLYDVEFRIVAACRNGTLCTLKRGWQEAKTIAVLDSQVWANFLMFSAICNKLILGGGIDQTRKVHSGSHHERLLGQLHFKGKKDLVAKDARNDHVLGADGHHVQGRTVRRFIVVQSPGLDLQRQERGRLLQVLQEHKIRLYQTNSDLNVTALMMWYLP